MENLLGGVSFSNMIDIGSNGKKRFPFHWDFSLPFQVLP